jgi:ABC-type transport system involved in multi-copper enzyme maturation permease subunit
VIRLTAREFRTQAIVALGALVIAAIVLAITGASLTHLYNTTVANCKMNGDCSTATSLFLSTDSGVQGTLDFLMIVIPGLIGIFWGAPLLARELETGTYRLAWTQSVTRARWLAVKIGIVGVSSLLATGLLSLMVTWWFGPLDRVNMSIFGSFDQRSIVPIGYAAFAFALGVTCGALLRRTLPAMATTLVGFVAVRLVIFAAVRPNLMAPLHRTVINTVIAHPTFTPDQGTLPANAWVLSDQTINAAGNVIGQNGSINGGTILSPGATGLTIQGVGTCPGIAPPTPGTGGVGPALQTCVDNLHIRDVLTYQPSGRYWPFQVYELAIFLTLALILVGLCFWWVRRRII